MDTVTKAKVGHAGLTADKLQNAEVGHLDTCGIQGLVLQAQHKPIV